MEYQQPTQPSEDKAEAFTANPTLSGENSTRIALAQQAGGESPTTSPLLDTPEAVRQPPVRPTRPAAMLPPTVAPSITGANAVQPQAVEAMRGRLAGCTQLPMGVADPAKVATACPIPEATMGVFELAADEQVDVTSTGFVTCVGLVIERELGGGGKRVGFSHVNGADLEASGIDALVDALGEGPVVAFLSYVGAIDEQDHTMAAVLEFLDTRGIEIGGVSVMAEDDDDDVDGGLMASLSGSGGPSFAQATDAHTAADMADREERMEAENPALGDRRKTAAWEKQVQARLNAGLISEQEALELLEGAANDPAVKRYPMAFHPSAAEGYRGHTW